MPDKITNKSRNVGTRKPGRPPKATVAPIDTTNWSNEFDEGLGTISLPATEGIGQVTGLQPLKYTGIEQVAHGLNFPTFDPNKYFPTDIFDDTSALPRTTKEEADKKVHSIEEKRQSARVGLANLGLMQDVVKIGQEHRKLEGLAIDYDKLRIDNHTKFIGWQTAGVNRDIAVNKWQQTTEKLIQGQQTLAGMQGLTALIGEEWEARRQLKVSSINDLKTKALRGSSAMDAKLSATIDTISSSSYED